MAYIPASYKNKQHIVSELMQHHNFLSQILVFAVKYQQSTS